MANSTGFIVSGLKIQVPKWFLLALTKSISIEVIVDRVTMISWVNPFYRLGDGEAGIFRRHRFCDQPVVPFPPRLRVLSGWKRDARSCLSKNPDTKQIETPQPITTGA